MTGPLITEFAAKSPDFVKGWPEKVDTSLERKFRYIFISNILYVNKTNAVLKKRSRPTPNLVVTTINRVNTDFYSIYFLYININNQRNDFILSLPFI